MRRAVWFALALAAACGSENKAGPAPLTGIRLPTGLAVHDGRVLVLNSNADLLYDEGSGGVLLDLAVGPSFAVTTVGAVRTHSMGGDLALARIAPQGAGVPDAEACGGLLSAPVALFATRGSNTLNVVAVGAGTGDTLTCSGPGAACGIPTSGAGFGDPYAVAVACGNGRARAYVGYLNAQNQSGWVGELDLAKAAAGTIEVRNGYVGPGAVRGFAYDRDRDRMYLAGVATGAPTPLRWLNLSGCDLGSGVATRACSYASAPLPVVGGTYGLELHGIALARPAVPGVPRAQAEPIRAYASGVLYDLASAAASGYRTTAFGSVLLVMDLYDDALGGVQPRIVAIHDVPSGAQNVSVLPRPAGWPASRRDVVAVVSTDTGALTVLDDETGAMEVFGADASGPGATGGPILGHQAYGLAVDPTISGSTARVWVGSFTDGFVTPIDVTVDPSLVATFAGGARVKITGATP